MGKRIISVLLIVGICLSVTACSPVENLFDIMDRITDNDNPLSGKSTDERIIMSLEDTYPEHTFSAINSFDNDKGEGLFSDEKGIRCCACMLSFSKGEHYHCAAIGQRPICPEEGGRRRDCPLKERKE